MRSRVSRSTKIFIAALSAGVVTFAIYGMSILRRYPWLTLTTHFQEGRDGLFFEQWPLSPLEDERLARKNLRRFPKQEQQRRLGIQLRRMKIVNSTLADILNEQSTQIFSHDETVFNALAGVPWPAIRTRRYLGAEGSEGRFVRYLIQPEQNFAHLSEAVLMTTGDEIRASFAVSRNHRAIVFSVVPLVPTTLRAQIGQYSSWAKSFSESEVNAPQDIQIPVSDATASVMRLQCALGGAYVMDARISQREGSGRIPIQVERTSPLFRANSKLLLNAADDVKEGDDDVDTPDDADATSTPPGDEANAEAAVAPTSTQPNVSEILDPDADHTNPQVISQNGRSTALGYNIVLFQLEEIPWDVISDPVLFKALAPNLYSFADDAFQVLGKLQLPDRDVDTFRRTILGSSPSSQIVANPFLLRKYLNKADVYNFYSKMRTFGYHTHAIATASALGFSSDIARTDFFPKLEGRWLEGSDWSLFRKQRELDAAREPLTGLDAVFPTKNDEVAPALGIKDLSFLGDYLRFAESHEDETPDWHSNELTILNGNKMFYARVVDAFQNWVKENTQLRYFTHVYLDSSQQKSRPALKDFWHVLKLRRVRAFTDQKRSEALARVSAIDRAFGQMVDALSARRVDHRTIVAVIFPHNSQIASNEQGGTLFLKVPGLIPRRDKTLESASLDDVMATLSTLVGIPLGSNVRDSVAPFSGKSLEVSGPSHQVFSPDASKIRKFQIVIEPGKTGCGSFEWLASSDIFGLFASHPVVELSSNGRTLRVFPCAIDAPLIELNWYQEFEPIQRTANASEDGVSGEPEVVLPIERMKNQLGGYFNIGSKIPDFRVLPTFVFGKEFFKVSDISISIEKLGIDNAVKIFDLGNRFQEEESGVLRKKLEIMERLNDSESDERRTIALFGYTEPRM